MMPDRAGARLLAEAMLDLLGAALALASADERYAALDAMWRAATSLERKAMTEAMMARLAGATI